MGTALHNQNLLKQSKLNELTFIDKYVECLNEIEAVELALEHDNPDFLSLDAEDGDLQVIASQVMARVPVQEALTHRLTQAVQTQRVLSCQWVLDKAGEIFAKCNQDQMVKDLNGRLVVGKFNPIGALRAIDVVGKHVDIQAFKETLEIDVGPNLQEMLTAARKRHDEAHAKIIDADDAEEGELIDE